MSTKNFASTEEPLLSNNTLALSAEQSIVTTAIGSKIGSPTIPASALWTVSLGSSMKVSDVAVVVSGEPSSERGFADPKTLEILLCFVCLCCIIRRKIIGSVSCVGLPDVF